MGGRIIGKIEEGRKITDVARELTSPTRLLECLAGVTGEVFVGSTTPAGDRYIVLSAERNRHITAQQAANWFLAATGQQILEHCS